MGRGISKRQRYAISYRAIKHYERLALKLPEVTGRVLREGLKLTVFGNGRKAIVSIRWIHASNGEAIGLVCINGAHDWGTFERRLAVALGRPQSEIRPS
jgi:hypothetical protein